jgi:hypothetical protein
MLYIPFRNQYNHHDTDAECADDDNATPSSDSDNGEPEKESKKPNGAIAHYEPLMMYLDNAG